MVHKVPYLISIFALIHYWRYTNEKPIEIEQSIGIALIDGYENVLNLHFHRIIFKLL